MPETKIEASRINQTIEFDFSEIGLSDGTVSLPSLAFTSDQSTGLYRIGASDMALATGGIKALELDSSQRISIPVQLSIANAAFKTSLNVGGTGVSAPANTGTTPAAGTVARFQGNSNAVLDIGSNSSTYAWIQSTDQTGLSATYPIALNPNGGQILYSDGTLSAPSIAFNAQANTGIYRAAASDLGIVAGGVLVAEFVSTKAIFSQPVLIPDGTVSAPGLNFGSDQTTGIYRGGAGNISLSSAGTSILSVNSSGLTMNSGKIFSNYFYGGAQATGVSANTGYVFDAKDNTTTGTYLRTRNTANSGDANLVVGMTATSATTSIGRFSHGGVDVLETDQSGTTVSFKLNVYNGTSQLPVLQGNTVQQALFADGTSGAPTVSFANQTTAGMYRVGTDVIGLTTSDGIPVKIGQGRVYVDNQSGSGGFGKIIGRSTGSGTSVTVTLANGETGLIFAYATQGGNTASATQLWLVTTSSNTSVAVSIGNATQGSNPTFSLSTTNTSHTITVTGGSTPQMTVVWLKFNE